MIKIYRKYFAFAGQRKRDIVMANLYAFICTFFESMQLIALGLALKAIIEQTVSEDTIGLTLILMVVGIAGSILFGNLFRLRDAKGSFYACADKRIEIGQRMRHMPMGFFTSRALGVLTAAMTTAVDDIQNIAPRIIMNCVQAFLHIAVMTLVIAIFDIRIGIIILVGIALYLFANNRMQSRMEKVSLDRVGARNPWWIPF